ncbi:MAG: metallophosphoesterase [Erysipelotrichaceae bacterium]
MKIVKKIGIVIAIVIILLTGLYAWGKTAAISDVQLTYLDYYANKIDASLDGMQIAFISDLYFGEFYDEERLTQLVKRINEANVDVLLFGGDLFADVQLDDEQISSVQAAFNSMNAQAGKFAVLGDLDVRSATRKELVTSILYEANFELLDNATARLYHNGSAYVELVGFQSATATAQQVASLYEQSQDKNLTIAFFHQPDFINQIPLQNTDLALAGHTFGGQIYIPFVSNFNETTKQMSYWRGRYQLGSTVLHVANGIGTTQEDFRLLTDAQILIYTLRAPS